MVLFTNLLKNVSIQDCENMIYNWEFDDSVDFAPPHYRKSKYQKVEQLGKQIINEATALEYLEAFEYVEYLSKYHKIDNLPMMCVFQTIALSMLKSKEAIFKWIIYPNRHKIWKQEFDYIRELEQKVINKQLDIYRYAKIIKSFNNKWTIMNKDNQKYGFQNHTLYWIKNKQLKYKMKDLI